MKKGKRLLSALLAAVLLFSFAACGGGGGGNGGTEGPGEVVVLEYGRYVETDITPEGLKGYPYALQVNGDVYDIISCEWGGYEVDYKSTYYRFRSTDKGATWQAVNMDWIEPYVNNNYDWENPPSEMYYLSGGMTILEDGTLLVGVETTFYDNQGMYQGSESSMLKIGLDGEAEPFELPIFEAFKDPNSYGYVSNMFSLPGGRVFIDCYVYSYDAQGNWLGDENTRGIYNVATGELLLDMKQHDGWISTYNDEWMILEEDNGDMYAVNLTTGERRDTEIPTYNRMASEGYYASSGQSYVDENFDMIVMGNYGLKKFSDREGVEDEMLMDGLNYTYGSPLQSVYTARFGEDGSIVLALNDRDSVSSLKRYEWDDEAVARTNQHIDVFSVYNNDTIRLALSQYRVTHPETTVSYEYALERYSYYYDEGETQSVEDILRNLNNDLLIGNGPDVLILDDMPLLSYIDKGILADISTAVEGVDIYPQVVEPYTNGGKLYAVPARMGVPLLFGDKGDVEQFTDFTTLVDAIVQGPALPGNSEWDWDNMTDEDWNRYYMAMNSPLPFNERPTLYTTELDELAAILFDMCLPAVYNEKTGIDQEALTQLLDAFGQITDKYELLANDYLAQTAADSYYLSAASSFITYSTSLNYYAEQKSRLGYGMLSGFESLTSLSFGSYYASHSWYGEDEDGNPLQPEVEFEEMEISAILAPGLATNVYYPQVIVGVTATSDNIWLATDFISSMLSEEVQGYNMYDGLAVTATGNELLYKKYNVREQWMVEEDIELVQLDYATLFEQLETPYHKNEYLTEIIYDTALEYCQGDRSLESAVNYIISQTELYFAERQ